MIKNKNKKKVKKKKIGSETIRRLYNVRRFRIILGNF